MKLAVIILSYNTKELLKKCLNSIEREKWRTSLSVVVVDNASVDGSVEMIKREFPGVSLIQNKENLGFTKGNNVALRKIKADYYLILNSDTQVKEGSIDKLVEF